MIIVQRWYGRLGNNILQVLRAISAANKLGHGCIRLPTHPIITNQEIFIGNGRCNDKQNLTGEFFDLNKYDLPNPSTAELKANADNYKRRFLPENFFSDDGVDHRLISTNYAAAHVRGGDIFCSKPHPTYLQPPLWFYWETLQHYQYLLLVKEDGRNPVVSKLLASDHIFDISVDEVQDFRSLMKAKNLVMSASTFSYAAFLLSDIVETLSLPDYYFNLLPNGDWPTGVQLNKVNLPNYMSPGEWRNGFFQRRKMISYHANS